MLLGEGQLISDFINGFTLSWWYAGTSYQDNNTCPIQTISKQFLLWNMDNEACCFEGTWPMLSLESDCYKAFINVWADKSKCIEKNPADAKSCK